MTAKAEVHYDEATGYWSWSVNYCGETRWESVTGYELTYEDALERVQYWLEELVDGIESDPLTSELEGDEHAGIS